MYWNGSVAQGRPFDGGIQGSSFCLQPFIKKINKKEVFPTVVVYAWAQEFKSSMNNSKTMSLKSKALSQEAVISQFL